MEKRDITDGINGATGAFCPEKMADEGVDSMMLSQALSRAFAPFACLLKDGHGVGVYVSGDDGSVIGFTAPTEPKATT